MTYQAVIFDFGGVFTTSPVQNFAAFEREHDLPERFIGNVIKANHHTNAWAQFERAEITLDAFDEAFAAESKAAGFEIRGRTLVELLSLHFNHNMIEALARNPSGRMTTVEDVAKVVCLMSRPEADWVRGSIIFCDGGEDIVG